MTEPSEGVGEDRQAGTVPLATDCIGESLLTAVLLCQGLQTLGNGLDLKELCRWVEETHAGVQVRVVPDLCHDPKELSRIATTGIRRMVLGLCTWDYSELEMQFQARKAGLDPLGMETVNLGTFCTRVPEGSVGIEKAKLLLATAVARARAYPGSSPEHLRPSFPSLSQKMSRRALFTLPPMQYQVVASIDHPRCIADTGCALCVSACPHGALERVGEKVWIKKTRCQGCGLCVTVCPQDAIQFPGNSPAQLEAQVTALLETDPVALTERGILFTCQRSIPAIEGAGREGVGASAHWLPVQVPCVGMVPVSWVLQCLARGAMVGVVACGDGCPSQQMETIRGRIDYCRQLLRLLGGSAERVRLLNPENGPDADPLPGGIGDMRSEGRDGGDSYPPLFAPEALAHALRKLVEEHGTSVTPSLKHPHSPMGVVAVEPQRCTACGVCAGTCPTGALGFTQDNEAVTLTFDAALCIACGQCIGVCPEGGAGAIRMDRVTDLAWLARGRAALYQDREARCETCGAPVAPLSMLNRVAALLGSEEATLAGRIGRYCPSCR